MEIAVQAYLDKDFLRKSRKAMVDLNAPNSLVDKIDFGLRQHAPDGMRQLKQEIQTFVDKVAPPKHGNLSVGFGLG